MSISSCAIFWVPGASQSKSSAGMSATNASRRQPPQDQVASWPCTHCILCCVGGSHHTWPGKVWAKNDVWAEPLSFQNCDNHVKTGQHCSGEGMCMAVLMVLDCTYTTASNSTEHCSAYLMIEWWHVWVSACMAGALWPESAPATTWEVCRSLSASRTAWLNANASSLPGWRPARMRALWITHPSRTSSRDSRSPCWTGFGAYPTAGSPSMSPTGYVMSGQHMGTISKATNPTSLRSVTLWLEAS